MLNVRSIYGVPIKTLLHYNDAEIINFNRIAIEEINYLCKLLVQ
jgi:hypothetical protein